MNVVPLKKSNLGAPDSGSFPMFLRRMNAFRDLGHIRSFRCVLKDTSVYESAKRSDRVDQREHDLSSGSKVGRTAAND
jgi:hypothetical protein